MNIFYSIILGIIQGLTEFLPVSSSGHLVLTQHFLGIGEGSDIVFEVFLHLGTALAVLVYFRKTLLELILSLFHWRPTIENQSHRHNRMLIVYLGISTLSTLVLYIIFKDVFEALFSKPLIVALMLSVTGAVIFASDFIRDKGIPAFSMGFLRSILIGLGQGMAIIPGLSRSGTTIACSLFSGIKRKDAAHYSFLLSIPAILGANLSQLDAMVGLEKSLMIAYIAGFIAAFISGYLVISVLIRLIQASKLKYFAYYCWAVSLASVLAISFS